MTTFLLVRHARHRLGSHTIAGRMTDVGLSVEGRAEAEELARRLADVSADALYSSPMQRAQETAAPLARQWRLNVITCDDLQEIDYGKWTGQTLDQLRGGEEWVRWNAFRSGHRAPGGESMMDAQARVVATILRLRDHHRDQRVVLVSHGDVIKSAVAYFLGMPLDLFQRMEISPASVSAFALDDHGPSVLYVNHTGQLGEAPPW